MKMRITMDNPEELSHAQNPAGNIKHISYALGYESLVYDPTSQMRVKTKNEVTLGRERLKETQWLFRQYGLKTPTWLRSKFRLNQSRRKCLNDNLQEAQLDSVYCGRCSNTNEWHDLLHSVWHDINGRPSCI